MQRLIWKNSKGDEINLTQNPFGITNWEGFSNTELNIQSQQVPFSDGSVFLDALMEQRELSVTLAINDENDLYRRYELKRQLISALNPKMGEGYLIYTNDFISKRIKCVARLQIFPNKNSNDAGTQKASLSWVACEPYWEDLEETEFLLYFGERKTLENNSDVPIFGEIDFITNNVDSPALLNLTTGKKIELKNEFKNPIYIKTEIGQKNISEELINFNSESVFFSQALCSNDRVCCVIGSSSIFVTTDGKKYREVLRPSSDEVLSCIFSKRINKFIAVGLNGLIMVGDENGDNWKSYPSGVSSTLWGIAESETRGIFIAVGEKGTILKSSDAQNWERVNSGFSNNFYSVIFCFEKCVIGGLSIIMTSSDLIAWEQVSNRTARALFLVDEILYSSVNNRNVYTSGTYLWRTTDLITWEETTYPSFVDVFYNEKFGLYFYFTQYGLFYSTTLFSHTIEILHESGYKEKFLTFLPSNNVFICVNSQNNKWYSYNGVDFINTYNNISDSFFVDSNLLVIDLNLIKYNGEIYVAVGSYGSILYSHDGVKFSKGFFDRQGGHPFINLAYSDKKKMWVVYDPVAHRYFTSLDGENWERAGGIWIDGMSSSVYCAELDRIFGVYDGYLYYSYVGDYSIPTNNKVYVGAGNFINIKDLDGYLYAVGTYNDKGIIYRCGDNYNYRSWSSFQSAVTQDCNGLRDIAKSKKMDLFVAVGLNGTIIYKRGSGDWNFGISFTAEHLSSVIFSEDYGLFIATGNNGVMGYSVDGQNWSSFAKTSSHDIKSITFNPQNKKFTAVGTSQYIANSEVVIRENILNRLSPDSNLNFEFKRGENILTLDKNNGNFVCRITYRQKYIGV